jgi:hypothetical protein
MYIVERACNVHSKLQKMKDNNQLERSNSKQTRSKDQEHQARQIPTPYEPVVKYGY